MRGTLPLLELRTRADAIADDVVANLAMHGALHGDVLEATRARAKAGDAACARFLELIATVPKWYRTGDVVVGREAATRQAPLTFLVLLVGSLVESFAIADGAAVLVKTGRLQRDSTRRIYETATLVRELLLVDEELPGGRAHEALVRVRLLHARVRRWVTTSPRAPGDSAWDSARLGLPVNQMDMLHTLLMFSRVVADGVEALGGSFDDDERASWCALWRYAGHMLGVDDEVLFRDAAEEADAYAQVRAHYAPDDGSRALAHAVLDALANAPPFFLPRSALDALARRTLGDDLADAFGLARSRTWQTAASGIARAMRVVDVGGRTLPSALGLAAGRAFIEGNRWRVLRSMKPADYGFRTA